MSVVLLTRATFYIVLFCVICVFCLLVVLVRLSVPVQMIDWKDFVSEMTIPCVDGDVKPYSLTHTHLGLSVFKYCHRTSSTVCRVVPLLLVSL